MAFGGPIGGCLVGRVLRWARPSHTHALNPVARAPMLAPMHTPAKKTRRNPNSQDAMRTYTRGWGTGSAIKEIAARFLTLTFTDEAKARGARAVTRVAAAHSLHLRSTSSLPAWCQRLLKRSQRGGRQLDNPHDVHVVHRPTAFSVRFASTPSFAATTCLTAPSPDPPSPPPRPFCRHRRITTRRF